ncbi:MAG: bifunctional riboflavin kinase/FAD synthetase [Halieaceae bacterium]|nr:bifunctional riboflavin kinase/FAD synthetase [Halieaceae bacterium]MCP5148037.1 bifunctional riboflavin kinase/FAD synthetase [Pseudomonadales bacterium]MCP5167075.1 bifunctional riboflavin kinase/FAD synthetase [Pseudomonadales bacterium]MCP5188483.1 bifunctional riboflavin kinase/FAD synthetase [Pseudomonadales bacterium]
MELIRGLHNMRPRHRGCVVTIGAFDGVHLGHQAVIRHLLEKSAELGLPSTIIVFEPLPREYFSPLKAPARIMSFREKFFALRDLGVDRLLRVRFNERLRGMSAQQFVDDIFVAGLGVRYVVLGDDFRFGNDREGDLEFIRQQGPRYGYEARPTPTLSMDGQRVSSTRIREALEQADFAEAARLLGRPYSISGKVVYGRQLGQTLGTPTANLELRRLRAPLNGVYAVQVSGAGLEGVLGVANVGVRPTVDDSIKANLEVHLLDREIGLYGQHIEVTFRYKLREEKKFGSVDELRENIARDIENTRAWFDRH